MKVSILKHLYVLGGNYSLVERIYSNRTRGNRGKKYVGMSKRARLAVKHGKLDGINLKKTDVFAP